MFYLNLIMFLICSIGTVCSIANMVKAEDLSTKIYRIISSTCMFIVSFYYGVMFFTGGNF